MFQPVSLLCPEYDLGWFYAAWAGHFTAFALAAQEHPLVLRFFPVRPETLSIRSRLLGPGEIRVDPQYGTILHTDSATYAVFEIHRIYSMQDFAATWAVAMARP